MEFEGQGYSVIKEKKRGIFWVFDERMHILSRILFGYVYEYVYTPTYVVAYVYVCRYFRTGGKKLGFFCVKEALLLRRIRSRRESLETEQRERERECESE